MNELKKMDESFTKNYFLFEAESTHDSRIISMCKAKETVWTASNNGIILIHDLEGNIIDKMRAPSKHELESHVPIFNFFCYIFVIIIFKLGIKYGLQRWIGVVGLFKRKHIWIFC